MLSTHNNDFEQSLLCKMCHAVFVYMYALNDCQSVDTAQGEAQAYGIDWNGPVPIECEG